MMVFSRAAGVMFTVDLVTGSDDSIIIETSYGLSEYVVQGTVTPDNFTVDRKVLLKSRTELLTIEAYQSWLKAEGDVLKRLFLLKEEKLQAITDEQVQGVATYAEAIEKHYRLLPWIWSGA